MIRHVNAVAVGADRPKSIEEMADQRAVTDLINSAFYVRSGAERPPLPQAFLVQKAPGAGTRLHFHNEDQFQIFIAGDGRVGPEQVTAPALHFANFHTAYGPIAAGDQGLTWLTLRDVADEGAWYLPEGRGQAEKAALRRNVSSNLAKERSAGLQIVVPPAEDGLAVWRLGLTPAQRVEPSDLPAFTPGAGGRFHLVLDGSIVWQGDRLGVRSLVYATAEERLSMTAGDDGADILILQFPRDRHERAGERN